MLSLVFLSFPFHIRCLSDKQTNQSSRWQCVYTLSDEKWYVINWRRERQKNNFVGSWSESWKRNRGKNENGTWTFKNVKGPLKSHLLCHIKMTHFSGKLLYISCHFIPSKNKTKQKDHSLNKIIWKN